MKSALRALALIAVAGATIAAMPERPTGAVKSAETMYAKAGKEIDPATHPGRAIYEQNCASCHQGAMPKAPHQDVLRMMAPVSIIEAMNNGLMKDMAAHLSAKDRMSVAEFLTRTSLDDYQPPKAPAMCEGKAATFDMTAPPALVGWGHDTRRFTPAAVAGMKAADVPKLKLKWAFAYPASVRARSQPAAAMGALFVGSQDGTVYALDADSGCARWAKRLGGEVRTGITLEPWTDGKAPARPRLFLGDISGNAYALDALTGDVLWKRHLDDHPNSTITGTPAYHDGKLFVPVSAFEVASTFDPAYRCCTFRGSVAALDAATGDLLWQHYTVPNPASPQGKTRVGTETLGPSGAPVWNSPAVDAKRGRIYFGSGENYSSPADGNSDAIFAVDIKTGQRLWQQQFTKGDAWNGSCMMQDHPNCPVENGPDVDFSASPMLIDLGHGKQAVVAGQKSGEVFAFDPDANGKLIWRNPVGRGGIQGGVHFGMAADGTRVYVPIVDLEHGRSAEPRTAPGFPGLHAVDARTGRILWRALASKDACKGRDMNCDPGISAAVTAMPGVVFAGHLDGWLRAYDGKTGKVIWQTDTTPSVRTPNGEMAKGGSMSGPGPLIVGGKLIVNSGYGLYYHTPGNALLVYSVDGK